MHPEFYRPHLANYRRVLLMFANKLILTLKINRLLLNTLHSTKF